MFFEHSGHDAICTVKPSQKTLKQQIRAGKRFEFGLKRKR